jgi:16S rRNA (guanine966-N2)-methyltransferase
MKIISGIYKGRTLEGYNISGTRPTMDRVKESLFAMIQDYIKDSTVLDLFSGSGNLGIEALSNGAKVAYLVDNNNIAIKTINSNIKKLNIDNAKVLKGDYKNILNNINTKFDLIFLDPPYETNYLEESIKLIINNELLKESGLIICESSSLDKIIYPNNFEVYKEKKYGDKYVVILKYI